MKPKLKTNLGFIEIQGKTVEEAIKQALKQLKVPRQQVKIEVLREPDKGLFGMPGAKPALIRVYPLN